MDEAEIIRTIKAGDIHAYALLVERYYRPLLAFIFKIVRDKDVVEDIGQEVFFSGYRSLNIFDEKKGVPFSAWIFTVARNHCISYLRQRRIREQRYVDVDTSLEDHKKNPEEEFFVREQKLAIAASLQQIPEPFRKTIMMSLEGCTLDDIAESQMVTLGTVKSRLFRARERMKILVGEHI
ncbi:MAG: sigma-70 family RNA polymerase sigma factor [Desulfocapsaceae bacterium]|nr:sigma-70 family RNA polymerase sigma factor [Desulfocapsaceae bacterium]